MIVLENKFLWAFINSELFDWYKRIKFVSYRDASTTGRVKLDYNKIVTVPVKNITINQLKESENFYNKIQRKLKSNHNVGITNFESEKDKVIYKIYDIKENEISIIDD